MRAALLFLLLVPSLAAAQSPDPLARPGDRAPASDRRALLFASPPAGPDDLLPPEDEMAFTRAVLLLRAGRLEEAGQELERLGAAYPGSRRVASARALAWVRRGQPKRALSVLDEAAARQREWARRQEPPGEPERFPLERAEAYLTLGENERAIPWMIEAVDRGDDSAEPVHALLTAWAADEKLGRRVAREAARLSDAAPGRVNLALLASEFDAVRGDWASAWARLDRTEELIFEEQRGDLHRSLARRLSASQAVPAAIDARAWLEVARRPFSEESRCEAFGLLLELRGLPVKQGVEVRASVLPAAELVGVWRSLPAVAERDALGLRLTAHLRDRAEWAAADEVAGEVSQERLPADLRGAALLEQGLARIRSGDLEGGRALIDRAAAEATGHATRAQALYAAAEARYFAGDFAGAHEEFTKFTELYPRERETNDALERLYLLEGGGTVGGPSISPGLVELASGHYAAARLAWGEAERLAVAAEERAASERRLAAARNAPGGADDDVRAHAVLLRSRALEAEGRVEEAVLAALWLADSLATHRLAPLARRRAAELLLAAGREDEALAQYEEILVRHPNSWIAPEVRRRVMELRSGKVQ